MAAGDLREMIRFERRPIQADDGYGNTLGEWATLAGPYPARIAPAVGNEETLADAQAGIDAVAITVRYCAATVAVNSGDRAVNVRTGKTFNITAVTNEDEHRRYLNILGVAGGADG